MLNPQPYPPDAYDASPDVTSLGDRDARSGALDGGMDGGAEAAMQPEAEGGTDATDAEPTDAGDASSEAATDAGEASTD